MPQKKEQRMPNIKHNLPVGQENVAILPNGQESVAIVENSKPSENDDDDEKQE